MSGDVIEELTEARRAGRTVVLATTVRTEGDPPSRPGNRALLGADGALLAGTVGCNGLDRLAGRDALALLDAGETSAVRRYTSFEGEPGEGEVEVFLEAFRAAAHLLVGGAGPVAAALAEIGVTIGWPVLEALPGTPSFDRQAAALHPGDAAVFVDHDDPALVASLTTVLATPAAYVGVMGSRRHTPGFLAQLRADGAGPDPRLHSPTGLDLGARTPPEIALSIWAEILAAVRGRPATTLDIVREQPAG